MATLGPIIGESAAEMAEAGSDLRYRAPADLAAPDAKARRHQFLKDSLGNDARAEQAYERIIAGDELQSITYLQRGMIAARAVARIDLGGGGFGTGFLIAPGVLITNNHVLPDASTASGAVAQFLYELNLDDAPLDLVNYRLQPAALFHTSPPLDFTVVAVASTSEDGTTPLSRFGVLPLLDVTGKASEGEWLTIVQHPSGNRKQVCVRENQLLKRDEDVLWYSTDTMPGSSGSPVFNNDWYVVALHHSGVRETTNGVVQKNSDGSVRWAANEGIRASRIARALKQALPNHPLLQPLYAATPASARISEPRTTPPPGPRPNRRESTNMPETRTVTVPLSVTLQVQADGSVVPLSVAQATESTGGGAFVVLEKAKKKPIASFDAPFDDDYSKRDGYQPDFLEKGDAKKHVGLPKLGDALQTEAAPLLKPQGNNKYVLHYHNYSVVMHAKRRLAIYSAANVTFGDRFDMSRPPDVWRRDPRILAEHQLENWYYAKNNFDRGHLTRREDLEFGRTPKIALGSAGDTCHWTNCTPQHSQFNQNEETWHGIERHILETSIYNGNLNAQIITGPVLEGIDPEYKGVQFPLQYWKVVAALDSEGKLFATAYVASQEEVIDQFGIEVTEVPFGPYKTYQTKISEIERLTGLFFGSGKDDKTPLRECDPLERVPAARRRRRRRAGADESFGARIPVAYHEITQLEDIEV